MNVRMKIGWIGVCMAAFIAAFSLNLGGIGDYVAAVKASGAAKAVVKPLFSEQELSELKQTIASEAEKQRIAPVNARIDRVWKAIPGYNGVDVDVDKSYEKTVAAGALTPIQFVYKEVNPEISLRDLGRYPIFRGNPEKKMIAFMINVAWGNEYIQPILDTLEKEQVKATFFLDGSWLKKYPDVAKQIQAKGHEMSNHAYSHPNMSELGRQAAYTQISRTEELLKSTLSVENKWFAPPSGDYNQTTIQVAAEQGLMTVLWTIDTVDWKKPPPDTIMRRISSKLEPGALILMHPTASSRDALPGMIRDAKQKGYAIGTVSELLSTQRVPSVVEPES
ncbi:polysaccharide deacetylase family protein [Paenibacillus gorillae]|uniref:polysaccharide deacetylase family protein n=1 Tax=Paenibacillus gorillae TaxID=1243662 RepID=UPI0004B2BF2F|nr:polysaccharide deacetylase family protein [Paenibacillus gorillae]